MAKIRDLPLDPTDRGRLGWEKIHTSDDLWRAIGTDFQDGLDTVLRKTGIPRGRLIRALATAAAESQWRLSPGEVVLGLAFVTLLAVAGLRVGEALGVHSFPVAALTSEVKQVVVVAPGGLPAFHVVKPDELGLISKSRMTHALKRKEDATGHFLLRPLPAGTLLHASDLSSVRLLANDLAGHWIVTLHIDPSKLAPHVVPGAHVLLVLAPEKGVARPAVEADALALAVEKGVGAGHAMVTVAIPSEARAEVAAALGSSEIFLGKVVPGKSVALGGSPP